MKLATSRMYIKKKKKLLKAKNLRYKHFKGKIEKLCRNSRDRMVAILVRLRKIKD